jgi:hypothetical protein
MIESSNRKFHHSGTPKRKNYQTSNKFKKSNNPTEKKQDFWLSLFTFGLIEILVYNIIIITTSDPLIATKYFHIKKEISSRIIWFIFNDNDVWQIVISS